MKNTQKGFVGIILIVILALALGIGGTYYVMNEKTANDESLTQNSNNTELPQSNNANMDNGTERTVVKTNNSQPAVSSNPNVNQQVLTDQDILSATYKISANFGGVRTPVANIVFPAQTGTNNHNLSGNMYMNKSGMVFENPRGEIFEGFWINGYKYTDSSRTEAKVFITGNFGASGFDDRAFVVDKINGVVTTKETTCNKAPNGSCTVDRN